MDSSQSSTSGEGNLAVREVRRVYLITYSQADTTKVPSRERFAEMVLEGFELRNVCDSAGEQWACCLEHHRTGGVHFHMAIKLSKPRRWLSIRQLIYARQEINVNFSNRHVNYFSAWRYVTKEDCDVLMSANHPDLWNTAPPATTGASEAIAAEREDAREIDGEDSGEEGGDSARTSNKRKRTPRLSMFDVSEIAVSKGIRSYLELLVLAKRQKMEGKTDLAQFIVNKGKGKVEEAIKTGWEIENSEQTLMRQRMSRMDILYEALAGSCVENCEGRWLGITDILQRNGIRR